MDWTYALDWTAVLLLGGAVGASELISRYRDDPVAALRTWPAVVYLAINTLASAGALGVIYANHGLGQKRWVQVLIAGVSAMVFFRTSLFTIRAGDRDVAVGPAAFLQIYLAAADRNVDRLRAATRAEAVARIMQGVDYARAFRSLPPLCLALMQNMSPEDQQALGRALKDLDQGPAEPSVKARLLGLELINVVGIDVLTTAVQSLGDEIRSLPRV